MICVTWFHSDYPSFQLFSLSGTTSYEWTSTSFFFFFTLALPSIHLKFKFNLFLLQCLDHTTFTPYPILAILFSIPNLPNLPNIYGILWNRIKLKILKIFLFELWHFGPILRSLALFTNNIKSIALFSSLFSKLNTENVCLSHSFGGYRKIWRWQRLSLQCQCYLSLLLVYLESSLSWFDDGRNDEVALFPKKFQLSSITVWLEISIQNGVNRICKWKGMKLVLILMFVWGYCYQY